MTGKLNIILLEDLPTDIELAEREIRAVIKNYELRVVETEDEFLKELKNFNPDLIISDYQMPTFDGLSALHYTRKKSQFIPFIILTGSMNEDTAVECMKAGADDYVIKEHIKRLGGAILNALEKKKIERDHHKTVVALQKSEERYRSLVENINDVHFMTDTNGIITYISPPIETITAYSPEEIIGLSFTDFIHPDDVFRIQQQFQKIMAGELGEREYRIKTKSGKYCWIRSSSRPIIKSGNPNGIQGILTNINERKLIESERERLSAAIEQAAEAVLITDDLGTIQYVNPAFEKISGYKKEEAIGQKPNILKSDKHNDAFFKNLWETITSGNIWKGEISNKNKNNNIYNVEVTISPVLNEAGKIANFVSVQRDITREQELEEQFHQAQKMESVGRLAGGVAHDFNNMLSVILGYSELAMRKLNPSDKMYTEMQEINNAGQRSAALTTQLLAFARKQEIAPKILDLNDAISNMIKMLRRLIGEDIELIWKPGANLNAIKIDPAQVDQILANLGVNARDAIGRTGKVIIETYNIKLDDDYCRLHAFAKPGEYVLLGFSDDGCGMDDKTLAKVFEPFFTTKTVGEGTGLGLSTVYGIVKQNNGLIEVESKPGFGTQFKIFFPKYEGKDLRGKEKQYQLPKGRGELILLVEDEKSILEMTQTMLTNIGYSVLTANTPQQGLKLAKTSKQKIDILLTDVIMPDMNGKELSNQLVKLYPSLKVLYMSGYTSDIIAQSGVISKEINFITKPFSLHSLALKLKQLCCLEEF